MLGFGKCTRGIMVRKKYEVVSAEKLDLLIHSTRHQRGLARSVFTPVRWRLESFMWHNMDRVGILFQVGEMVAGRFDLYASGAADFDVMEWEAARIIVYALYSKDGPRSRGGRETHG